jgi:hypothetical protein
MTWTAIGEERIMRTIQVSTDTYAAVWGARKPGEDSEDEILARVLKVARAPTSKTANGQPTPNKIGFRDPRFGIELAEGFEIFRTYLGTDYRATAKDGGWVLAHTGKSYPSFNQLSRAIGAKIENAWNNWYYAGADGKRQLITTLRQGDDSRSHQS